MQAISDKWHAKVPYQHSTVTVLPQSIKATITIKTNNVLDL